MDLKANKSCYNIINQVLDHAVERELANSKSVGANLQAEQIFLTTIRADVPTLSGSEFSKKVRSQVKKTTREGVQLKVSEHAENLQMQGQLLFQMSHLPRHRQASSAAA